MLIAARRLLPKAVGLLGTPVDVDVNVVAHQQPQKALILLIYKKY